jgi:hypothetical protein
LKTWKWRRVAVGNVEMAEGLGVNRAKNTLFKQEETESGGD